MDVVDGYDEREDGEGRRHHILCGQAGFDALLVAKLEAIRRRWEGGLFRRGQVHY